MESNSDCEVAKPAMEDAAIHAGEPNIFVRMPVLVSKKK